MCGINGFNFFDSSRLRQMHATTRHRGPDDEGFFESEKISFAHNRLSIIDLSESGRQPMTSADGRFMIVFNGEIYNYRELRVQLEGEGETFKTKTDTEVLLRAFMRWGEECLKKLNGIFAFVIWDAELEKLILVRDQVGVKPLYYFWDGTRLIFSSELKSILVHDVPREIDMEAFNLYFRFLYVPGTKTMLKGIKKLEPGSIATLHDNTFQIRKWWSVKEGQYITDRKFAVEEIRRTTKEAVTRQMVSDRPLGVFLSGGIDSSSILGIMSEVASGPVKTFTVEYDTDIQREKFNADARLAEKTAAYFGAEHHTFMVRPEDAISSLEKVVWHMDEPVSNHIQSSTYLLAQYSKPHITVALGGDGGDELFGGYSRYWYSSFIDRIQSLQMPMRTQVISFVVDRLLGKMQDVPKFLSDAGMERFLMFVMQKEGDVSRILKQSVNNPHVASDYFTSQFEQIWKDKTNQLMAVDVQNWIPSESLIRSDKLTMAHGLEQRVPLLDSELVDLAFRIPSKWKVGSRKQGKQIFIDAMRPYLPPHVLGEEKRGWFSPTAKWIRGPLLPFVKEVLSPEFNPEMKEYFDFDAIQKVLDDHVSMRKYGLNTIWSIVTFQLWYRSIMRM